MPRLVSALPSAPTLSTLLGVQVDLCDNLFPKKSSWKEVHWTSSVLRFLVVTGATLSCFAHPCVMTSGRTCGAAPITVLQCLRAARVCSVWISVDATDPDPGNSSPVWLLLPESWEGSPTIRGKGGSNFFVLSTLCPKTICFSVLTKTFAPGKSQSRIKSAPALPGGSHHRLTNLQGFCVSHVLPEARGVPAFLRLCGGGCPHCAHPRAP